MVKLSVRKQCPFVIMKANYTTSCISNSTVSGTKEVINTLYLLFGGSTWPILYNFGLTSTRETVKLEQIHWTATKLVKGLEHVAYQAGPR